MFSGVKSRGQVSVTDDLGQRLYATSAGGQLQASYVGGLVSLSGPYWRLVLLKSGTLTERSLSGQHLVRAPALIWHPPQRSGIKLQLSAGGQCDLILISEGTLNAVLGHRPEAIALRAFGGESGVYSLQGLAHLQQDLEKGCEAILGEYKRRQPGAQTLVEAHIRIILVLLWRQFATLVDDKVAVASRALLLQKFRQQLETHFRERWKVTRYADVLHVSADRLHDLCHATLGKAPQQLIHERLASEAEGLLRESEMTLNQISIHLGFHNASQFNVFINQHLGMPPGRYRKTVRERSSASTALFTPSYADWP